MLSLFALIGHLLKKLKRYQSNTFEPNAYIGESPTVKHGEPKPNPTLCRTNHNQPDLHGRIRLARRQNRVIHEQAKLDGVIPMWDEVDWNEKATPKPDAWQEEVEWENIDE